MTRHTQPRPAKKKPPPLSQKTSTKQATCFFWRVGVLLVKKPIYNQGHHVEQDMSWGFLLIQQQQPLSLEDPFLGKAFPSHYFNPFLEDHPI